MSQSESEQACSSPDVKSDSKGSSVSTELRDEYEDLLRYAVVTPKAPPSLPGMCMNVPVHGSRQEHSYPSHILPSRPHVPPRPRTPPCPATRGHPQPEISKVLSDVSARSDLADPPEEVNKLAAPFIRPPHPFTAMNVQQHEMTTISPVSTVPDVSRDSSLTSHDSQVGSRDLEQRNNHRADPELVRLDSQLDERCTALKLNVLAEFEQARMRLLEKRQLELEKEKQQHTCELWETHNQLEQLKQLLVSYEKSIGQKDLIIINLTRALQKQKEHVELQKTFTSWQVHHVDDQRQLFTTTLARRHYQNKVKGRVWAAWFGVLKSRWKQKVERACQGKAEEVCVKLSGEYDEQLAAVQRSLEESHKEIKLLKAERDLYEENMKKSFMRGVCALNMEAMSMFRYHEPEQGGTHEDGSHYDNRTKQGDNQQPLTLVPQATVSPSQIMKQAHPSSMTTLHVTTSANPLKNVGTPVLNGPEPNGPMRINAVSDSVQTAPIANRTTTVMRPGRGVANSASYRVHKPAIFVQKH